MDKRDFLFLIVRIVDLLKITLVEFLKKYIGNFLIFGRVYEGTLRAISEEIPRPREIFGGISAEFSIEISGEITEEIY